MFRDFLELFDPGFGVPYQGVFDPGLVSLSVATAIVAAFVALSLASRITASNSVRGRLAWTAAGAFSMGGGISTRSSTRS